MDFNRVNLSIEPINTAVNDAIARAVAAAAEEPRPYLGASQVGHECLRRIQFDWWCKPEHEAKTRERFRRGDYFEERMRRHLVAAGFKCAPRDALGFSALNGATRTRGRHHYSWPEPAGRLSDLSADLGAQGPQRQGLERDRARRAREEIPALSRTGFALSGVLKHHQSRAVHGDERRYL